MLWLGLRLPDLAVELLARASPAGQAIAVYAGQQVFACNTAAAALGVAPGLAVSAARALAHDAWLRPRDRSAEAEALHRVATAALRFSPQLSLAPPDALLLEVGGSLNLFGGIPGLLGALHEFAATLGHRLQHALAPSPSAALLFARSEPGAVLTEAAALADRLAALPTDQLPLPPPLLAQLAALGLGRVGACLALPRAAAARRLTPQFLDCLDRLLGHRPEPLPLFTPPARFRSVLEMPCEVDDAAALHFALHRQLIELALWLHGRGAAVQGFSVELRHAPPQAATRLRIGLAAPSRDGARMSALARERLQSLALPAPVRGLVLHAARVVPFAPSNLSLFPSPEEAAEELPALLDKLRARLGETAVYALACCPEHRPERAWRRTEPGQGSAAAAPWPQRPLWLVDPPRPLPQRDARPYWNGPLQLEHGPERIEAGWWDGGAVGRDYFAARSADHSRLWVFLEHHSGDWFLHGFFS